MMARTRTAVKGQKDAILVRGLWNITWKMIAAMFRDFSRFQKHKKNVESTTWSQQRTLIVQ
jgi:hypothetical protein